MKVNGDSIPHKRKSTISSRRSSATHKMKSLPSDFFEKILLLEMEKVIKTILRIIILNRIKLACINRGKKLEGCKMLIRGEGATKSLHPQRIGSEKI